AAERVRASEVAGRALAALVLSAAGAATRSRSRARSAVAGRRAVRPPTSTAPGLKWIVTMRPMTSPPSNRAHAPTEVTRPINAPSTAPPTEPPARAARPKRPIREMTATEPATRSTPRGRGALVHRSAVLSAITARTGANHAAPKAENMPSRIPDRIAPAWLRIASTPNRAASINRTPTISRTWRELRRGRAGRLLRLERDEEARRAPDRDELRDVVRRMLRALEPIGFYPSRPGILSAWRLTRPQTLRSDSSCSSRSRASAIFNHARFE